MSPAFEEDAVAEVAEASRCSVASRVDGEPVEATAPHAVSWVGAVVPGSWPADASLRAPDGLRRALSDATDVRLVLLRPVGRAPTPVGLVLAGTVPGRTWLREVAAEQVAAAVAVLADPASGAVQALRTGHDPGLGVAVDSPAVLVCTNGARDACCARDGRPAAAALQEAFSVGRPRLLRAARRRADVWESSHLGGHRFAPTAAVLPHGMVLGGLGPGPEGLVAAVVDLLDGRPVLEGYRGRSTYRPPEQAAETAVRRHLALLGVNAWPGDVRVDGSEPVQATRASAGGGDDGAGGSGGGAVAVAVAAAEARRVLVRHSGGRTFRVLVQRVETDLLRPASCGAAPTPVVLWQCQVDADTAPGVYFGG